MNCAHCLWGIVLLTALSACRYWRQPERERPDCFVSARPDEIEAVYKMRRNIDRSAYTLGTHDGNFEYLWGKGWGWKDWPLEQFDTIRSVDGCERRDIRTFHAGSGFEDSPLLKQGRITKWDVVLSLPVEDWGDRARFILIERKGQVMEIDVAEWLRRRGEKQERR